MRKGGRTEGTAGFSLSGPALGTQIQDATSLAAFPGGWWIKDGSKERQLVAGAIPTPESFSACFVLHGGSAEARSAAEV